MRNMIFKTIFASILVSFLVTPLAHADRQGGGTLKVALSSLDANATEWVRFKGIDGVQVLFDYSWIKDSGKGIEQIAIDKADFSSKTTELVRALLDSKVSGDWSLLRAELSD